MEWAELETQVYLCDGTVGSTILFGCIGSGNTAPTQIFQGDYANPDTGLNKVREARSEATKHCEYCAF